MQRRAREHLHVRVQARARRAHSRNSSEQRRASQVQRRRARRKKRVRAGFPFPRERSGTAVPRVLRAVRPLPHEVRWEKRSGIRGFPVSGGGRSSRLLSVECSSLVSVWRIFFSNSWIIPERFLKTRTPKEHSPSEHAPPGTHLREHHRDFKTSRRPGSRLSGTYSTSIPSASRIREARNSMQEVIVCTRAP